jgi:hypothetical protein
LLAEPFRGVNEGDAPEEVGGAARSLRKEHAYRTLRVLLCGGWRGTRCQRAAHQYQCGMMNDE